MVVCLVDLGRRFARVRAFLVSSGMMTKFLVDARWGREVGVENGTRIGRVNSVRNISIVTFVSVCI